MTRWGGLGLCEPVGSGGCRRKRTEGNGDSHTTNPYRSNFSKQRWKKEMIFRNGTHLIYPPHLPAGGPVHRAAAVPQQQGGDGEAAGKHQAGGGGGEEGAGREVVRNGARA